MVAVALAVLVLGGLLTFYVLMRLYKPPATARADLRRFAKLWIPGATAIIVANELLRH